uniref:Uncharacterized protein n=1 Tax=Rhizophora mucronata TaxID=61149 RepID=A0A2P2JX75_RHIMU
MSKEQYNTGTMISTCNKVLDHHYPKYNKQQQTNESLSLHRTIKLITKTSLLVTCITATFPNKARNFVFLLNYQ